MDQGGANTAKEGLSVIISDTNFQKLEKQFAKFCPFEAVGMVRAEIRHSNFLGYMLNPFRPHGFGTTLLKAFLNCALSEGAIVGSDTLSDAEIRREWRNIDLLILLPGAKRVVVIELKIDASQSPGQLEKYRKIVEATWPSFEGWKYDYLFLTKHSETPNDAHWIEFKLHNLVDAFDLVAQSSEHRNMPALDMLRSYILMMRRHHLGDRELEEIARELWSKHEDTLTFLMDRRPDPLQEIFNQIKVETGAFLTKISPSGVPVVADKHIKRILRYAFKPWDELTDFKTARDWTNTRRLVLLEVKLEATCIRAHLMIGPGTTPSRESYVAGLQATGRGQYISVTDEELLTLNSEGEATVESLTSKMSRFTRQVFSKFDPVMRDVSAELSVTNKYRNSNPGQST